MCAERWDFESELKSCGYIGLKLYVTIVLRLQSVCVVKHFRSLLCVRHFITRSKPETTSVIAVVQF